MYLDINLLSAIGGMTFFLVILHCIGDWLLQSEFVALNKTHNFMVRFLHVFLYTFVFSFFLEWPYLLWIGVSHFIIDSYKPLYYFRKLMGDSSAEDIESFKESFKTVRGFVVYVNMDQILHLLTLVPVAVLKVLENSSF